MHQPATYAPATARRAKTLIASSSTSNAPHAASAFLAVMHLYHHTSKQPLKAAPLWLNSICPGEQWTASTEVVLPKGKTVLMADEPRNDPRWLGGSAHAFLYAVSSNLRLISGINRCRNLTTPCGAVKAYPSRNSCKPIGSNSRNSLMQSPYALLLPLKYWK